MSFVSLLGASKVVVAVKNPSANAGDIGDASLITGLGRSPGWEDPLQECMATHSRIFAWRIPCSEEPGELQSVGS